MAKPVTKFVKADALAYLRKSTRRSVDLIIGSPPYAGKGERYVGGVVKWDTPAWVAWMADVTEAAVAVSRGYVFWVVNGFVKNDCYHPACEGLVWQCYERGIVCDRPCIWHKNAPPNRKKYFSNDWEFVLAFKSEECVTAFNWEAIAEPPKYTSGGQFRQRNAKGERRLGSKYPKNKLARPRDVFRVTVGGGQLGSDLAHENEAPYPEKLVEPFIRVFTNPGDTVLDPFSGSGTTVAVAKRLGRNGIGVDFRDSQVRLGRKRLADG